MYSTTKQASEAVRQAMKTLGFNVKVSIVPGAQAVRVVTKTYEAKFSEEEKQMILKQLHSMGFTGARGADLSKMATCDSNQIEGWLK
jgi:hypothetical protein